MGSSSSKPSKPEEHVFTAETPVRFSPNLLQSLEQSSESDNTRASDLELHIQRRVADELRRLDAETTASIKKLEEEISATPDNSAATENSVRKPDITGQSASTPGIDHASGASGGKTWELSRAKVQEDIDTLKEKLRARKMRENVIGDKDIAKAKEKVVQCLRVHDRRPLDCWREVEGFKREVGRFEKELLGRVIE